MHKNCFSQFYCKHLFKQRSWRKNNGYNSGRIWRILKDKLVVGLLDLVPADLRQPELPLSHDLTHVVHNGCQLSAISLYASRRHCNHSKRHLREYLRRNSIDLDETWHRDGKGKRVTLQNFRRNYSRALEKGEKCQPFCDESRIVLVSSALQISTKLVRNT